MICFVFFSLFFRKDSNLVAKNFARQEGSFWYLTSSTLPYLHKVRNLSNIRYLFTYRTSSTSTSTHRHSGLSFHHQLAGLVSPIDQISPVEPPSYLSTISFSQVLSSPVP